MRADRAGEGRRAGPRGLGRLPGRRESSMLIRGRIGLIAVLAGAFALAGCGDDASTGQVQNDPGRDPDRMKAMQNYMENRPGMKKAKPKAEPKEEAPAEPKPAP